MTHHSVVNVDGSYRVKVGRASGDSMTVLTTVFETREEAQMVADHFNAEEHIQAAANLLGGLPLHAAQDVGRMAYDLIVNAVSLRNEEDPDYHPADPNGWLA